MLTEQRTAIIDYGQGASLLEPVTSLPSELSPTFAHMLCTATGAFQDYSDGKRWSRDDVFDAVVQRHQDNPQFQLQLVVATDSPEIVDTLLTYKERFPNANIRVIPRRSRLGIQFSQSDTTFRLEHSWIDKKTGWPNEEVVDSERTTEPYILGEVADFAELFRKLQREAKPLSSATAKRLKRKISRNAKRDFPYCYGIR